uniref:Coiled-coil domain containing 141 n=1 Tax=Dicentrarchus labrax TaxID=13489 RepID=A0A8P4KA54_DICLA
MTSGETEETCGGQTKSERGTGGGRGGGREGNMKLSRSFTTLSTIAVQAGQSQIVVSVLESGSVVHLQLVQVHPGLCEIGSNHEENQTLVQEQQQLMEKLKKHEKEVLSVVEKSRQIELRRRRDEGMMMEQKRNKKQEEEEEVYKAMAASLKEGWVLLLRLLERRQEVLMLASDFYRRALEFAVGIDGVEGLRIRPDRLTEGQLTYDSMRRDLLGKSLQVITSSNVFLQKLRQLQKIEALQRRGGVLQDNEEEEVEECSRGSRGMALRLEELVEMLQDRRRRADQAVRLQLQQAENGIMVREKESTHNEDWSLTVDKIPDLQFGSTSAESTDLKLDSRTKEDRNLQPGSRSDVKSGSRPDETRNLQSGFKLKLAESRSDLEPSDVKPGSGSEETKDLQSGSRSDLQPGFRLEFKPRARAEESRNLQSGFKLNLNPESRSDLESDSKSEGTRDLQPGSGSNIKPSDVKPGCRVDKTRNLQSGSTSAETDRKPDFRTKETRDMQPGSRSDVKPASKPEETRNLPSGLKLNLKPESRSDLESDSNSEQTRDLQSGSRLDHIPGSGLYVKPESRSEPSRDLVTGSRLEETRNLQSRFKFNLKPESRSKQTRDLQPTSGSDLKPSDVNPGSRIDKTRILQSGCTSAETDMKPGSRTKEIRDLQPGFRLEFKAGSRLEETRNLQSGFKLNLTPDSRSDPELLDVKPGSRSDLQPGSRSDEQPGSGLDVKPESRSEPTDAAPESRSKETTNLQPRPRSETRKPQLESTLDVQSMLGNETETDHAHQALLTNQRQQLLSSCQHLVDKVWSWVQWGSSVLSNSSAGRQLSEAEDSLNTHLQLQTQAESAAHEAESMKQILDQIRGLHPEPSRQLSPLKALTEQLKRGSSGRTGPTPPAPPAADPAGSLSPELADRVDLVLKELQSLNRKIDSNLQLLRPYVTFLRSAQQVEEEMEELREIYKSRLEEEEEKQKEREAGNNIRTTTSSKKQDDACWQEILQRFHTAQELGNNYVLTVPMVSGAGLNLQSVVSVVQQTMERLSTTKQEVNELQSQQQIQIQQQQDYCRKSRERLLKTLQDLNCVSELLDSCTLMDLGSDLQTSRLLEHFSQARPHFSQLDTEVEHLEKSWETLRGVQDRLEVEELKGRPVTEEDLAELLKLQKRVKNKIHQSESILDLSSSFHRTSKQLEALLQSDLASPSTGSTGSAGLCGSSEAELSRHREEQQQIQSLFKTASTLKTDICTAVSHSGWTCFRVEQLEARLVSLDSLCVSWLNEAARREEKLRREQLACRLNGDINQLRDSFKELKKRFSNLKFNYLKRNDRTRNTKAVRNQLQQVELYEEKLQALRKRLQGVTGRLGLEVKDGGVAREAEDAVNELQRQMGDFERSVSDHQKTLEMTRRLQQAMEEYQFWCEEASATITRVGKFSSECRSTEAVSVLYRQFEKFVWPTVPQQEERISQIAELAVRLHGVEEGQRYIEKTVSKHSEMVESIRELSDGLMKLEAKLKLENLKKQQNDGEKEVKEEEETERGRENETEEKDKDNEKKLKENRKLKKKEQTDNRSSQEAADMYELKETGHTPELTAEHDGKEVPVKRQTAANRKRPLQKSRSQDADRQTAVTESSHRQLYSSTHTVSLSCSPVEANRRVCAIHSQIQAAAAEPQATPPPSSVIGPLFSDIQKEFQRKEMRDTCGLNMTPPQDASAGGLSEAELLEQEVLTEDSLSNDEYDCASPDDISLPPLAETPESNMMQSDVEESFCFSSHSVHINQYSHQCRAQSDHSGTGTGAVRQQRESRQTESCPTPPTSLHSSTRFRSDSSSFVQSPLTVPAPSLLTTTLCGILKTAETSTTNIPQSADLSLGGSELSFPTGSNPTCKNITPDSSSNKDINVPEKRSLSSQYNQPQKTGNQSKITQKVSSKGNPFFPQSSYSPQPSGPEQDLPKNKTPLQDTMFPDSESDLHQDINCSQTRKETPRVSKPQTTSLTNTSTSTITQQTIYLQSSPSNSNCTLTQASSSSSPQESRLSQSETLPKLDPVPQAQSSCLIDSVLHKERTQDTGFLKPCATCPQTSTTTSQDNNLPQAYPDSRSGLDQDVPSSQTCQETPSRPQSSNLTTASTPKNIYCQSSPPNSHCNVPQASSNLRSQQGIPFSQSNGGLPEVNAPILPDSFSNISLSSSTISNRLSNKQSHQTVYSHHESLTSTCTQKCVHDPESQALAQQANLHVTPLSSPLHLLTPDQDPNICQPVAIREEIRLTPQIQGPPLPAPPPLPQAQAESLPQGKASKPGPPCFTRPLSRATVMEGSPVTLEVEVTGHPEPTLTWWVAYNQLHNNTQAL